MEYNKKDLLFFDNDNNDFDGDIRFEDGDFKVASIEETNMQEVYNRIKTNNPEWYRNYNIGADLEDLRGEKNSQRSAEWGREKILNSLTHDGRFSSSDLRIKPVPTGKNELTFYIFIDLGYKKPLVISYKIDTE